MGRVLKGLLVVLTALVVVGHGLWLLGPYEQVDTDIVFDTAGVPDDIDGWLADREGRVADLSPDAAKRVVWVGVPGRRTDIAIVYVHGFSATLWEIRPVPERVGEALGANVFFTRLAGHGRSGAAMGEVDAGDWVEDMAEAMAVAAKLGDRVVVMGTSTGGTLAAMLATDPAMEGMRTRLAGVVLVSPNFRVKARAAMLLSWPAARYWADLVAGETRSFAPVNARHARHWTTEYPTRALLPMQALIDHVAALDFGATDIPALFRFSPDDAVVDARATEAVAAAWGGPTTVQRVTLPPGDDPFHHVIAGDILSPAATPEAIADIAAWMRGL